ncbi:MAG: PulJ/GspJ family protein [Desulfitobacterium sp.]
MRIYRNQGFALLDVVLALFLFALGFAALYGLSESAMKEAEQALRITEAANQAQSILESLANESWRDNIDTGHCLPGGEVRGREGIFHWTIYTDWELPEELLRVRVEIAWLEKGSERKYTLESLYAVQ